MSDDISKDAINSWDPSNSINDDNSRYASYSRDANNRRDANNGGNTRRVFNNTKDAMPAVIPSTSRTSKTYQEHQRQATAADLARAGVSSTKLQF